ncbi:hypothetical protein N752_02185 [Desulforamulus aquiferis]|nr:DUF4367 domain-containing protein [Desulforamulus aquiferis]RYD06832.1 hypothetical protein N752_02185 [Desulforamulus aquiferis]
MNCPDRGVWQAFLDKEIPQQDMEKYHKHAEKCQQCQDTLKELLDLEKWSDNSLAMYQEAVDNTVQEKSIGTLEYGFIQKKQSKGGIFMKNKITRWFTIAASVIVITGLITFAPVQQAVADLLSIFRVQKIEMVKINPQELEQMAKAIESKVGEVDLKQFGKVEVSTKPEQVKVALAKAKEELPFNVKEPKVIPSGYSLQDSVTLHRPGKANFELDVKQVNTLLQSLGATTLIPDSLAGKAFSLDIPAGIRADFLNDNGNTSFTLTQFSTPELVVPSGVDPLSLRNALLDLPILPEDLRNQLAGISDWQNTMIIPDMGKENMETIHLGEIEAVYSTNLNGHSHMMWVDNGVIYQLSGWLDREQAIGIAENLK